MEKIYNHFCTQYEGPQCRFFIPVYNSSLLICSEFALHKALTLSCLDDHTQQSFPASFTWFFPSPLHILFIYVFIYCEMGFELKALHLQCRHSTA
jgi:hypothetical protein